MNQRLASYLRRLADEIDPPKAKRGRPRRVEAAAADAQYSQAVDDAIAALDRP